MTAILRTLAPYAISLVLAALMWFQRGQIESQDIALKAYGQIIKGQDSDLADLKDRMTGQRLDLLQLERTQDEIRNALDQRTFDIERLKNEDPQIRSWADSLLPDPIARLRQRPAITGAAAYAEYLRTRDTVQPAGGGSEVARRPDAVD